MIEFYKYLYAGVPPPHAVLVSNIYPRNEKANQMCPVVQLSSPLIFIHIRNILILIQECEVSWTTGQK